MDGEGGSPLGLSGVVKRWPGRQAPVLAGVDLELDAATVTWLGGDNGAGKTTLLRVVAGLIAPSEGSVRICGFDLQGAPREGKRRLGFLAAGSSGLYARLNARQQLDYWARIAFVPRRGRGEVVAEAIERFGLTGLQRQRQDRMSMGERQRVRLAMTFMHSPELVLLDEPRSSLDADGLALLMDAVEVVTARGGAVLWCSPSNEPPAGRVDHALEIRAGEVRAA